MSFRTAGALSVPVSLWLSSEMLDALVARDIAQVFRLTQRATGVSQTHLGIAIGLSQAQVSEIICGTRRVSSIDVLTRICAGLRMPVEARAALLLGERMQDPTPVRDLSGQLSDVEAVYASRSEFTSKMPPHALFDGASDIRASGLSLNLICQQYADTELVQLVEKGARIRLLFLDPAGSATRHREIEEGHTAGHLGALTTLNLQGVLRVRDRLPTDLHDRIEVATYDQTLRVNITLISETLCIAQHYLPHARGVESPTAVIRKRLPGGGLYAVYERVFTEMWESAQPR